ncbi:MAG: hypothetical protein RID09_01880 [Coleofasciculus sp. G1-WW12-02]|uniref:hypothetical protein n=1 Tax=Coleofasciculus sp. G1-WW12-02 TaxID=3068483 RepID=UPI0032FA6974
MNTKTSQRIKKQIILTGEFALPILAELLYPGLGFAINAILFAWYFLKKDNPKNSK